MIRPELATALRRWAEPIWATGVTLAGLWLVGRGGWFFGLLGGLLAAVALIWLLAALRRSRFTRDIAAPGVVEIDEGAIRYLGASALGGQIALRELSEIRLMRLHGHAHWRLKSNSGEALLIPLEAAGAPALADAFAALPGIDMGAVAAALARIEQGGPAVISLWSPSPTTTTGRPV